MIKVKNLNFEYGNTAILHDVGFHIKLGSITALVGPNGAGKTTLMRCISGAEIAVSGSIIVDNIDVIEQPRDVYKSIGYLSDFFGLYDNLTVRQNLIYMAWCHELSDIEVSTRVDEIINLLELTKYQDSSAGVLSRGYRQRLGIGISLLHQPKLLLLDEPASGMDPEARIKFSRLIQKLKKQGYTMVISSHILAELEDYCTDMLVIRDGRIAEHVFLKEHQVKENFILNISILNLSDEHMVILSKQKEIHNLEKIADNTVKVTIISNSGEDTQHKLLRRLLNKKVPIYQFYTQQKSLQTAYMDLAEQKND